MGVTGVGKSRFISWFNPGATTGDGLTSWTTTVGVYPATIGSQNIFLVDTPGFDDTLRADTDILREVADWLNQTNKANIKLAGIVYLHRISDNRMAGASMKSLRLFKKLCGEQGLPCVILATTMWAQPPTVEQVAREQELSSEEKFWGEMVEKGSSIRRHYDEEISATNIIKEILERRHRITLQIQDEMAEGKDLDETSAGRELDAEIMKLKKRYEKELADLRTDLRRAQYEHDEQTQKQILVERAETERRLQEQERKRDQLQVSMEELRRQREEEIREHREMALQQQLDHQRALLKQESDLQALKLQNEYETRLVQKEYTSEIRRLQEELQLVQRNQRRGCVVM
ncbi:hypothetical protein N8T08_004746 [Aspergillus melleus]|uniref:Uncharacterized protein n=1 Tax=Aspergillus melleus TaxID=138277 RepID=A0ACC3B3N1_9EURO|nr:hypothetical protein N8T08_004746 [Aspergillus melleus]